MDAKKVKLIERIQEIASHFDAAAQSQAIEAIRKPTDKIRMESAMRYMSLADDRQLMAKSVIEAIHAYWPK
jgi:hypothetical protein